MRPDCFVILAAMRTGSNLLEAALNSAVGVSCLGEAYNPVFVGHPKLTELLGYTLATREADPKGLLDRIRAEPGVSGFRWFQDHDPRVFDLVFADPAIAKIVLTRRPLDSYVSLKIARATGQWKLGDLKHRRSAAIRFDSEEFGTYLADWRSYQSRIRRSLQVTGQTAFCIDYDDLASPEVINGLLGHLGSASRIDALPKSLVPQNPGELRAKVENFDEMERALAAFDAFGIHGPGLTEAGPAPGVPRFLVSADAPLLFLPIPGGPTDRVRRWLEGAEPSAGKSVIGGFTQGSLRQWMRDNPRHRSFCVLRHPLLRAFGAFAALAETPNDHPVRKQLAAAYKIALPQGGRLRLEPQADVRTAFLAFLRFLKGNLDGQTGIRTDPGWTTQSALIAGMAQVVQPDIIAREDSLAADLGFLGSRVGFTAPVPAPQDPDPLLRALCDEEVERACRQAYQRDYVAFGFGPFGRQAA